MRVLVKKWGNSLAVRIPAPVARASHLELDEIVEVREDCGRIVIEPLHQKNYDLDQLIRGITRGNRHDIIDYGVPQGKELW